MPKIPHKRANKRLATRQRLSDVATRLFLERGFDNVTIDEVAAAADVSRMTVFNHFARKEDLFFDLDQTVREDLLAALRHSPPGTSPIQALRHFAHTAVAERRPYIGFFGPGTGRFLATVHASEALQSRTRAIRDEFTTLLTEALATGPTPLPRPAAHLAAALLVATATVALSEAYRRFLETADPNQANTLFLALIDQGTTAAQATLPSLTPS